MSLLSLVRYVARMYTSRNKSRGWFFLILGSQLFIYLLIHSFSSNWINTTGGSWLQTKVFRRTTVYPLQFQLGNNIIMWKYSNKKLWHYEINNRIIIWITCRSYFWWIRGDRLTSYSWITLVSDLFRGWL